MRRLAGVLILGVLSKVTSVGCSLVSIPEKRGGPALGLVASACEIYSEESRPGNSQRLRGRPEQRCIFRNVCNP